MDGKAKWSGEKQEQRELASKSIVDSEGLASGDQTVYDSIIAHQTQVAAALAGTHRLRSEKSIDGLSSSFLDKS